MKTSRLIDVRFAPEDLDRGLRCSRSNRRGFYQRKFRRGTSEMELSWFSGLVQNLSKMPFSNFNPFGGERKIMKDQCMSWICLDVHPDLTLKTCLSLASWNGRYSNSKQQLLKRKSRMCKSWDELSKPLSCNFLQFAGAPWVFPFRDETFGKLQVVIFSKDESVETFRERIDKKDFHFRLPETQHPQAVHRRFQAARRTEEKGSFVTANNAGVWVSPCQTASQATREKVGRFISRVLHGAGVFFFCGMF